MPKEGSRRCPSQTKSLLNHSPSFGRYKRMGVVCSDRGSSAYLSALDRASIEMDIQPFAKFIATSAARSANQVNAQGLSALNELAAYDQETEI